MNIAIDCRYIGKSGIGRVLEGFLDEIDFSAHSYYLIGDEKKLETYKNKAFIYSNNVNPYSLRGLTFFPKEINKLCECIFIPNFIIPFGIKIPVYSIVHDLIFLDRRETTKGMIDRFIKKTLYKRCFRKSKKIFCVSNFTIDRCQYYYKKYSFKCILNYPGISKRIIEESANKKTISKDAVIIYIGNVKPHKGIDFLLNAFESMGQSDLKLKIIGEKDAFLVGAKFEEDKYKNVVFSGKVDDFTLIEEIKRARYLIQPSYYEGFGLPPLEALYLGTQPIISNIPVFKEIYKDLPVKFYNSKDELIECIKEKPDIIPVNFHAPNYLFSNFTKVILDIIETTLGDVD